MKILSLGWGVQSFTIAAMIALGELEPVDFAIHADTLHESKLTYEFAKKWTHWLKDMGLNVVTVENPTGGIFEIAKKKGQTHIPLFTLSAFGKFGQLRRSCTQRWKIAPMRKYIQANRNGEQVEQWIGISLDEFQRMKHSDVKYITHRWPLIEKKMTRRDCENWLTEHGIEIPPKSSCVFCPFHNTEQWRQTRENADDWKVSLEVDELLRNKRPGYRVYVHPSRKPLADVDLRTEEEKGQMSMWDSECFGICGV